MLTVCQILVVIFGFLFYLHNGLSLKFESE